MQMMIFMIYNFLNILVAFAIKSAEECSKCSVYFWLFYLWNHTFVFSNNSVPTPVNLSTYLMLSTYYLLSYCCLCKWNNKCILLRTMAIYYVRKFDLIFRRERGTSEINCLPLFALATESVQQIIGLNFIRMNTPVVQKISATKYPHQVRCILLWNPKTVKFFRRLFPINLVLYIFFFT